MKINEQILSRIENAVRDAESRTRGEIVPVLVRQSSDYSEAWLRLLIMGALAAGLSSVFFHEYLRGGWILTIPRFCAEIALGAGLGLLLGLDSGVRRRVLGRAGIAEAVHLRALAEFTRHGVMNTNDRCGILLLVSLFEHRVELLADQGIHAVVGPEYWSEETSRLAREIRSRDLGPALEESIGRLGALLAAKFPREADTKNELSDRLRT